MPISQRIHNYTIGTVEEARETQVFPVRNGLRLMPISLTDGVRKAAARYKRSADLAGVAGGADLAELQRKPARLRGTRRRSRNH